MDKKKPTVMGMIIDRSGMMKDYWRTAKLYERYLKEKSRPRANPKRLERMQEELKDAANSAYESMSRITTAYQKAAEALAKELPQETTPNETTSYIAELVKRTNDVKLIKDEMNGTTQ